MVPAASTTPVTSDGLGGQDGGPARHRRQGGADHAAAVLAADRQHGQDGDHRLAELDPGEAELGRDRSQPRPGTGRRERHATAGQRDGAQQPPVARRWSREQQPQAGRRRSRSFVHSACSAGLMRPSGAAGRPPGPGAAAAQAHSTAKPGPRRQRVVAVATACRCWSTCGYGRSVCWTAKAAAGVTRSQPLPSAPAGRTGLATEDVRQDDRRDDRGDRPGAAPEHGADGQRQDGGDGEQRRGPGHHPQLGQRAHREQVVAVVAQRAARRAGPRRRRPASPAANVTEPITMALAASTRPRRGLAAKVTRIRSRRYSAVMNSVPTTITAISPANAPDQAVLDGRPATRAAGRSGAMSPVPVTVNVPPAR